MKVFVSGSFDLFHSGHAAFLQEAATYGDLYVGIGTDSSIKFLKDRPTVCLQDERLYMVSANKYVKSASINSGVGVMDFEDNPFFKDCDILVANEDQDNERKRSLCESMGKKYIVLKREPNEGLPIRTSTQQRKYMGENKFFNAITEELSKLDNDMILMVASLIKKAEGTIYVFGNGGSASTASHFAQDMNKMCGSRFICLNDSIATVTAHGNDDGYDLIFKNQLKGRLNKGDITMGISCSGDSVNVINALRYAKDIGNTTVGLVGFAGGAVKPLVDYYIHVKCSDMQVCEDVHLAVCHYITKLIYGNISI